jgi:glycosyltransferase involved in cell wall biosynthesis
LTAVHQFLPVYAARSAISNHADEVAKTLRSLGYRSDIWVTSSWRPGRRHVRDWREYAATAAATSGEPTWLLYQLSTGSPMGDFIAHRPEPRIVNYHNITPAAMVGPWEPLLVPELLEGYRNLDELATGCRLAIADSGFNGAELVAAGYGRVVVVPVLVDLEALGAPADAGVARVLAAAKAGGGADWLFVGRLAPNKCQHQVVKAFAVYRRRYDPRARLWLVGGASSSVYGAALGRLVAALGLSDAVVLTGSVPQAALVSYYRGADVFVCLSEHEGFCVPLLEAMWHGVPVVALGATAVPETVGSAGVVLPPGGGSGVVAGVAGGAAVVAAAVDRVLGDSVLREALVTRGRARAEEFSLERNRRRFAAAFTDVMSEVSP